MVPNPQELCSFAQAAEVDPTTDPQIRIPTLSHHSRGGCSSLKDTFAANTGHFGAIYTFLLGLRLYFLIIMSAFRTLTGQMQMAMSWDSDSEGGRKRSRWGPTGLESLCSSRWQKTALTSSLFHFFHLQHLLTPAALLASPFTEHLMVSDTH